MQEKGCANETGHKQETGTAFVDDACIDAPLVMRCW
jgi:hypothetical protein